MSKTPRVQSRDRFFAGGKGVVVHASAPGRLDVMGGIADYSGSLVLQMPIAERTQVWLRKRTDGRARVSSRSAADHHHASEVSLALRDLVDNPVATDYSTAQAVLRKTPGGDWAAYVIGCFLVLHREKRLPLDGADIHIDSAVPFGKGVSSSAALEVATMTAIARAWRLKLGVTELPILAQQVENHVVGAPCGLMDQLASCLGRANRLLPILCQPDRVGPALTIPRGVRFIGIDSGVRHAVSGSSYGKVRCAAFMGYSLIARSLGVSAQALKRARVTGQRKGLPFEGYLANITPSVFAQQFRVKLPQRMTAQEFMKRGGSTIDPITQVENRTAYAVEACTAHPILECERVKTFALLLQSLGRTKTTGRAGAQERGALLQALGELMYQSHMSYGACGLGEPATDALVDAVRSAGPQQGLYGAKITGGGSGGTVCVLCDGARGVRAARRIAAAMGKRWGRRLAVFAGSSEGARFSK